MPQILFIRLKGRGENCNKTPKILPTPLGTNQKIDGNPQMQLASKMGKGASNQ